MSLGKLRKERKCLICWAALPKGAIAYRPMLFATVNTVMRCDRVCPDCMVTHGVFVVGS